MAIRPANSRQAEVPFNTAFSNAIFAPKTSWSMSARCSAELPLEANESTVGLVELRAKNLQQLQDGVFDVLVVGAGINGAVSAACMAARGGRVALVDRGDFGGVTSQSSSNLAWGGIKYLESFEFGLVAKLCASRNHLLRSFPSAVREIRF